MPKIVVVEDQQVLATIYRNKFRAEGYQVEVASDGEAGITLINSANPDLVILDMMLPKLNGIEVLKRIRANPLFKTLPVLVFSNSGLPDMVENAWNAGATLVLSKSNHSPKQMVESVRTALKTVSESQASLPLAVTNTTATQPAAALDRSQRCSTPGHILLVEDHCDTRTLISFLLDQAGHQVTSVESHAGALREAKRQVFDLFLISRNCPDGLGVNLCRQLRESFSNQPVVMHSTVALATEQQAGLEAGARFYLTLPGDYLDIGSLLSGLLQESSGLQRPLAILPVAA